MRKKRKLIAVLLSATLMVSMFAQTVFAAGKYRGDMPNGVVMIQVNRAGCGILNSNDAKLKFTSDEISFEIPVDPTLMPVEEEEETYYLYLGYGNLKRQVLDALTEKVGEFTTEKTDLRGVVLDFFSWLSEKEQAFDITLTGGGGSHYVGKWYVDFIPNKVMKILTDTIVEEVQADYPDEGFNDIKTIVNYFLRDNEIKNCIFVGINELYECGYITAQQATLSSFPLIFLDNKRGDIITYMTTDQYGGMLFSMIPVDCDCMSALEVTKGQSQWGKPTLSWEAVPGAAKYEIYRSGYSNGEYTKMYTTSSKSYTNTSAKPGYTYYYKVKAISQKNDQIISECESIKQLCLLEKPSVQKGNNGEGKPKLTWQAVPGAVKYEIYRADYSNSTYRKLYTTTATSFTNTSAKAGCTYYYKVKAISNNNQNANSESAVIKQKCTSAGLSVNKSTTGAGKPKLTWKAPSGAAKYEIYRADYSNDTYKKLYTTTATSFTNTSAKSGYTYFYKVKVIYKANQSSDFVESKIISVKCK